MREKERIKLQEEKVNNLVTGGRGVSYDRGNINRK